MMEHSYHFDVAVTGGGVAGSAAAIAAAECGCRTILIEQEGGPGGVAVFGGCPVFDGAGTDGEAIIGGVAARFIGAMDEKRSVVQTSTSGAVSQPVRPYSGVYAASELDIINQLNRMLKAAGVTLLYYSSVCGVERSGRKLKALDVYSMGNRFTVSADAFVDATGDVNLAKLAGIPVSEPPVESSMTKTVLFQVSGVRNFDKIALRQRFSALAQEGKFPYPAQDKFMGSRVGNDGDSLLLNATLVSGDALDPFDRTRMDIELREQIPVMIEWFKENLPELKDCRFRSMASRIGVRAGRRLLGRETITMADLDANTPVSDAVARGRRGYGGHGVKSFDSGVHHYNDGWRGIPYGALLSPELENYFAAGRAISVEVEAITSIRLMMCCMATGEAAGCAAALGKGVVPDYASLRTALLRRGVLL